MKIPYSVLAIVLTAFIAINISKVSPNGVLVFNSWDFYISMAVASLIMLVVKEMLDYMDPL